MVSLVRSDDIRLRVILSWCGRLAPRVVVGDATPKYSHVDLGAAVAAVVDTVGDTVATISVSVGAVVAAIRVSVDDGDDGAVVSVDVGDDAAVVSVDIGDFGESSGYQATNPILVFVCSS